MIQYTVVAIATAALALPAPCLAQEAEGWSFHGQATYIIEHKPSFDAPYTGPNSLGPEAARSYSFTTTLLVGKRLWQGGEAFANFEAVRGVPFSNLTGLGGFTNGELQKTAGPSLKWYRARLFLRQTFGFGGGTETVEEDKNQFGEEADKRRLVITAGNLAVTDLFDNELSSAHRDYLAGGGLGFFLGDGQLNYREEHILEAYYNLCVVRSLTFSVDVQRVVNPAYNADRGPANFYGFRAHADF